MYSWFTKIDKSYFCESSVHYLQCDLSISVCQLYIIYSVIFLFQWVNCTFSTVWFIYFSESTVHYLVWFIYFSGSIVHYLQCDLSILVNQLYIIYSVIFCQFQWVNCTLSTVWFVYFSGSTVHYLQCDLSILVNQLYIIYSVIYLFQWVNCDKKSHCR
jgi:hypothetical protein